MNAAVPTSSDLPASPHEPYCVAGLSAMAERTQAAEQLAASRQRLALATQSAGIGVWDLHVVTGALEWDERMYTLYGVDPLDFSGAYDAWRAGVHPDDLARAETDLEAAIANGRFDTEFRIVRPDGDVRHIEAHATVIRDAAGKAQRVIGVNWDITERKQAAAAIAASEHRYRHLFDANPLPMWVYDLESLAFLAVNDAAVEHYGYSRTQFLSMTIRDIRPADEIPALLISVAQKTVATGHSGRWRHRRFDGSLIDVEIASHDIEFIGRRAKLVLAHDVTKRVEQEARLARIGRIRAVIGGITSAMLHVRDRVDLLQQACRVAVTNGVFPMAWVSALDPRTREFEIVASEGGDPRSIDFIRAMRAALAETDRPGARVARTMQRLVANDLAVEPALTPLRDELLRRGYRAGAAFPLCVQGRLSAVLVLLAGERGFFDAEELELLDWLAADLSFALEHIEQAKRLEYLAYYDAVTGLPNARLFRDRLGQFIEAARTAAAKVCVVALDLEGFSRLNDTLGREAGDRLLAQIGQRIAAFLVEPYSVGRIGSDTFIVASPRDQGRIATRLRDRLLEALEQPFHVDGRSVKVGAQLGIAFYPSDGDHAESVLSSAEFALSEARSAGEQYAYFSSEIDRRIAERHALEDSLRTAVERQEFVLHYQARVDLTSGELVGAEALIRWQHPHGGLEPPDRFIPLAEETGLIVPIGSWVIDTVCAQQAAWLAAGIDVVPLAVNVSAAQFRGDDLMRVVRVALAKHRLDPQLLDIELTESTMMKDLDSTLRVMSELRRLGVGLALDDFGTGHSSLAHLKRFPFDTVKIDRAFVAEVTQNPDDAAIATAIIAMGHRLKLKVVAEGVETEAQACFLRSHACDEMQGHYYEAALPADRFASLLRSRQRLQLPARPQQARTLLVVDDEPGIRSALNRVLRRDGYRILCAASGAEALELLALNTVQVIVSDQRMPGMSGAAFLDTVKDMYPDTMRIILSGYTDLDTVTDAVNRGAVFKFLTKPWEDDQLREHVRDAFRRHIAPAGSTEAIPGA